MLHNFLKRQNFKSYEDFKENFQIHVPDNFNFAYDVVDRLAETDPERIALIWCNDNGEEKFLTLKR